jgi:hypothetical protein
VREGYGLPRDAARGVAAAGVIIPPMPVAWTPEIVRSLFPIRFGLGRDISLARTKSGTRLYVRSREWNEYPATMEGWVAVWTDLAAALKPARLQGGITSVLQGKRWAKSTPFRNVEASLEANSLGTLLLPALSFLGGHGYGDTLETGTIADLRLSSEDVLLTNVRDGSVVWSTAAKRVVEVEANGAGSTTTGGFVATAGHGLVRDLWEQQSAQWLTDRYGQTTVSTFIRLETDTAELFFRSLTDTPEAAQVNLSALRALARGRPGAAGGGGASAGASAETADAQPTLASPASVADPAPVPEPGPAADDLVSRLERLARLRDSGALSTAEFEIAKSKLLY